MKKLSMTIIFLLFSLFLFSSQDQSVSPTTSISVPVRVLDGQTFVDSVTLENFEVYENGILQKIEALYLIKNSVVERRDTIREFNPVLARDFYLLFQLTDWDPKLGEAVEYFFSNVFLPGDTLIIMTPQQNYRLTPESLKARSKEETSEEMIKILKKDIQLGSSRYNTLLRNLRRLVAEIKSAAGVSTRAEEGAVDTSFQDSSMGLELVLPRYADAVQEMDSLRFVNEMTFIKFAESLKKLPNQKNVFLIYQREFRPEIDPGLVSEMMITFQQKPHIQGRLSELFQLYKSETLFTEGRLNRAFADSCILLNFIFTDQIAKRFSGIYMNELSGDIFKTFSEAAKFSGGVVETSQNPAAGFQKAAENASHYYLLYYTPTNLTKDGSFRTIQVNVKDQKYTIQNRQGYYAR
jgi:hypothetical protein